MKRLTLPLLLCLFFLVGCGPVLTSGEIYQMKFVPEHKEKRTSTTYVNNIPITSTYHVTVPDKWLVSFKSNDNEENEWRHRTIQVSKEFYDQHKAGEWIELEQ